MGKKKPIRHMGMAMSEEEHRRWHEERKGQGLTPAEHEKLMKHLGISAQEDRRWHEAQQRAPAAGAEAPPKGDPVNCFAIGGGFLEYCVKQGWLLKQSQGRATKYFVTEAGRAALAEYGIVKY
jgi:hypothetical protein